MGSLLVRHHLMFSIILQTSPDSDVSEVLDYLFAVGVWGWGFRILG